MERVRVGLIGAGVMGTYGHFPGYMEIPTQAQVVAVCDKNPKAVENIVQKSGARGYSNYEELLENKSIDAVDLCLPHNLHGPVALAALKAGKHVIVEKPFTIDLEQADQIIGEAKSRKLKLMVAENMRFIKAYEVAKRLADSGEIGEICYVRGYTGGPNEDSSDPSNWRIRAAESGGGTMMDDGIHCFYLFNWFVGKVQSVYAVTTKYGKSAISEVEDNAVGTLRFSNGALGIFGFSTTTASPWTEEFQLFGTKGSIFVDFLSSNPLRLYSTVRRSTDSSQWWSRYGDVSWEYPFVQHSTTEWVTSSMRREVQHFVDCILNDKEPLVTGEDGKRAVQICLKAYESARTGKEVSI
ncbi:MAG TPA: Gfo/Idh/MocA family oxidoreductase [Nitrososphaerales archaeon]|nr:Gfo/Idh/MocA family oxidoreductase [Nitrososphaerales archaeon]